MRRFRVRRWRSWRESCTIWYYKMGYFKRLSARVGGKLLLDDWGEPTLLAYVKLMRVLRNCRRRRKIRHFLNSRSTTRYIIIDFMATHIIRSSIWVCIARSSRWNWVILWVIRWDWRCRNIGIIWWCATNVDVDRLLRWRRRKLCLRFSWVCVCVRIWVIWVRIRWVIWTSTS